MFRAIRFFFKKFCIQPSVLVIFSTLKAKNISNILKSTSWFRGWKWKVWSDTIARAVTGRRCPHSGEGEDFLTCQQDLLRTAITRKRKFEKLILTGNELSLWGVQTGCFLDNGPKLGVLKIAKWHKPETVKNQGEPRKVTHRSETGIFLLWSKWGSCSLGCTGDKPCSSRTQVTTVWSLGDDRATNHHCQKRHCHQLQTVVTWVLDEPKGTQKEENHLNTISKMMVTIVQALLYTSSSR